MHYDTLPAPSNSFLGPADKGIDVYLNVTCPTGNFFDRENDELSHVITLHCNDYSRVHLL